MLLQVASSQKLGLAKVSIRLHSQRILFPGLLGPEGHTPDTLSQVYNALHITCLCNYV